MNKKVTTAALTAGAVYAGIGLFTFYEVTGKNARLPKYIIDIFNKKHPMPSSEPKKKDVGSEWFNQQEFEEYEITGTKGFPIRAYMIPADKPTDKVILCSHGYRSNKGDFRFASKFLHEQGYNVFIVDHQAAGKSDGTFITLGAYESKDLLLWIDFLIRKFGKDVQIALYGISMGCASVTLLSNKKTLPDNVKFIIADCGFTSVMEEFDSALKSVGVPSKPLLFTANLSSKLLGKWDFRDVNPINSVRGARVPILFIHGENDDLVPTEMVCRLYNACISEKDLLVVPGAGHACSYQTDHELYEAKVKEFAAKYFK